MTEILGTVILGPDDHLIIRVSEETSLDEMQQLLTVLHVRFGERVTVIHGATAECLDVDLKARVDRLEERLTGVCETNHLWDGS